MPKVLTAPPGAPHTDFLCGSRGRAYFVKLDKGTPFMFSDQVMWRPLQTQVPLRFEPGGRSFCGVSEGFLGWREEIAAHSCNPGRRHSIGSTVQKFGWTEACIVTRFFDAAFCCLRSRGKHGGYSRRSLAEEAVFSRKCRRELPCWQATHLC